VTTRIDVEPVLGDTTEVAHNLGTEDVVVSAFTADGQPRGHAYWVPIDADRFDIALSDDTAYLIVQRAETAT
jgi:hypothetical protein